MSKKTSKKSKKTSKTPRKTDEPGNKPKNKIKKKSQLEKKTTKSIIIATVVILVVFGIILLSRPISQTVIDAKQKQVFREYYGFIFDDIDGLWKTQIQKAGTDTVYEINLHYAPWELEDFPVYGDVINFFDSIVLNNLNALYITFTFPSQQNNYLALAGAELSMNIKTVMNLTPVSACTSISAGECEKRPIVDCSYQNAFVIEFVEEYDKEKQGIFTEKNCLIIAADEMEFLKAVDKLLYIVYRIPIKSLN